MLREHLHIASDIPVFYKDMVDLCTQLFPKFDAETYFQHY